MGKERNLAASVSWDQMSAAIQANPARGQRLLSKATATAAAMIPQERPLSWLPGWNEDSSMVVADTVSLVLWAQDPMYRGASVGVRRQLERELASGLLNASEKAWKEKSGRTRGWVRKHLEEDLRARSAGADPAPDAWENARTVRRAATLIDYICVMRDLRVALWWPEHHAVTVIGVGSTVVNINCTSGRVMMGSQGWKVAAADWPTLVTGAVDMTWAPAASAPSMSAMTVAQIQEALMALQPDAIKTGGRQQLWTRYNWARLLRSLKGLPDPIETDAPHASDGPTPVDSS